MANTYKNIVITPNRDTDAANVPVIRFSGGDATLNTDINLRVYTTQSGTLSFEGSAGQLFSITNDLTNTIFSVNDVSGIPSLEIDAAGLVKLAEFGGNVAVGRANATYKVDVAGTVNASAILINGQSVLATIAGANTAVGAGANTVGVAAFTRANNSLLSSSYTASDVLSKLLTVDGAASGLDADLLDGQHGSFYATDAKATAAFDKANSTTYTSNVVISAADNTNAALRITQTGTGEAIRVEDSANPDTTPFVIDSSGRVGIGTTSLDELFQVAGAVVSSSATLANKTSATSVDFSTGFNSGRILSWGSVGSVANISFWSGSGAGGAIERMRIDPTGNLLIGRTNSTVGQGIKLDVNGGINASAVLVNGAPISGGATIFTDTVNATRYVVFDDATSGTMTQANVSTSLTFNPNTGTLSSTIFNSTSDETLKYDISRVNNAMGIIDQINGVKFKWKDNDRSSLGVIAQEVEKVLPELVVKDKYTTVNYNGLIAVLIEAIKEMKDKIITLENKIDSK